MSTQNNQYLHKYQDDPRLWMNAQTADRLGLHDNDLVKVKSDVGQIQIALQVTQAIRPDCVYMTPGFGHQSMGLTHRLRRRRQRQRSTHHLHRSGERRSGAVPDICHG